jgi:putative peptidoglycan lipid II flippase
MLGDWGRDILQRTLEVARRQLAEVVSLVVVVLGGALAIAVLLGHQLVELLYEHGAFTRSDTTQVYHLLLLGLAGFALDAVSVTVSSMLLARQRNDLAIRTGYIRFAIRLAALVAGASLFGIVGVPLAWGLASCIGLALNLRWLAVERVALDFGRLRAALTVFGGVVAAAAVLAVVLPQAELAGRLAGALVASGIALLALRSVRPRTA